MNEIKADMVQFTKFAATNGSSAPKYEHLPRLVSQVHIMAEQNVKKKYLVCQIPIKMLKQHATPNFT